MHLRKLELKDTIGIISWMHDDSINCFFANDFKNFMAQDVHRFIESSNTNNECQHYACVNENDEYLGTVSLKNIDTKNKNAEYAISFCKVAQGTGAAKFATKEILRIAFENLNLERVYLNVLTENIRANRFYQKFGFIFEGEFKKHICINETLKDLSWYRMLKDEYTKIIK